MIVILKPNTAPQEVEELMGLFRKGGMEPRLLTGSSRSVVAALGDSTHVDPAAVQALGCVAKLIQVQEATPLAGRTLHPQDTVVTLPNGAKLGGGNFLVMAGPCSVENEDQILTAARAVKAAGAQVLRGGAFKPRSSPYTFQGLKQEGISLLLKAKQETGLPIITELMDLDQLPLFDEVDIIQVGARNMQNYPLLSQLGKLRKPVLLKRGMGCTLQELLMSAEYILSGGNDQVILCERGIRTFETAARNTLDLCAVPLLQKMSHLPVVVDPSHATGSWELVPPMALAATAAGADGLLIEVHGDPVHALSDGPQSLRLDRFSRLMDGIRAVRPLASRSFSQISPKAE